MQRSLWTKRTKKMDEESVYPFSNKSYYGIPQNYRDITLTAVAAAAKIYNTMLLVIKLQL